jgi:hypothetical protein
MSHPPDCCGGITGFIGVDHGSRIIIDTKDRSTKRRRPHKLKLLSVNPDQNTVRSVFKGYWLARDFFLNGEFSPSRLPANPFSVPYPLSAKDSYSSSREDWHRVINCPLHSG